MKKSLLIILVSITVAVISGCSDTPQLQPLTENSTVLAFGDSLTYGTGTSRDKAYPAALQALIKRRVINAGIPGEVTSSGLIRLPGLIKQHQPELIIICHGGNDILRKLDIKQTQNNIQQMIDLARQNNSQVLLIGVPEFGLFLNSSPIYQALAENNQAPIANEILGDILGKLALKSDHIHPNSDGYQKLAEHLYVLLRDTGALPEF